jgi:hypothetical protein
MDHTMWALALQVSLLFALVISVMCRNIQWLTIKSKQMKVLRASITELHIIWYHICYVHVEKMKFRTVKHDPALIQLLPLPNSTFTQHMLLLILDLCVDLFLVITLSVLVFSESLNLWWYHLHSFSFMDVCFKENSSLSF